MPGRNVRLRRYEHDVALAIALHMIGEAGRSALAVGDFVAVNTVEDARALGERLIAESSIAERPEPSAFNERMLLDPALARIVRNKRNDTF